ncbi:MAG TPA: Slp family lipoprotein [Nitrospirota bacterium]|nr:Slp family lipoprotein [Nitrospirota bacterium]
MKRFMTMAILAVMLAACAPVLSREVMSEGTREVRMDWLRETPEVFKDKLFILGGIVANTRLTPDGSEIEALYVPVDALGNLKDGAHIQGRFLALYPKASGMLDPVIYKKGREVTVAGEFTGIRNGKIDEMEYAFPVFKIRQIYLWREPSPMYYAPYYYYPYPYYYPYGYDRWGRPFYDPFWPGPW